jgi:uncharacterized membrane protein
MLKRTLPLFLLALTASLGFGQPTYHAVPLPALGGPNSYSTAYWSNADASKIIGAAYYPFGVGASNTYNVCYQYSNGTFTNLPTPGFDCKIATATSTGDFAGALINNQVDPASGATFPNSFAYAYTNGAFSPLLPSIQTPVMSNATGINSKGAVSGWVWTDPVPAFNTLPDGTQFASFVFSAGYGFIYSAGQAKRLGTLGGHWSGAYAINDAGDAVGLASLAKDGVTYMFSEPYRAVIFRGDQLIDLGLPHDANSTAVGINNSGQVTGYAVYRAAPYAPVLRQDSFFYDGANLLTIPGPVGISAQVFLTAALINDAGEVIGSYSTANSAVLPFYYLKGNTYDLNSLVTDLPSGAVLTSVTYLGPDGKIIALAQTSGDPSLSPAGAYLLTPIASAGHHLAPGGIARQ